VVGHTTKNMTHGSSWDMEIGIPSVEDVTLGLRPRVTCSTSDRHISMSTHYRASSVYCPGDGRSVRWGRMARDAECRQQHVVRLDDAECRSLAGRRRNFNFLQRHRERTCRVTWPPRWRHRRCRRVLTFVSPSLLFHDHKLQSVGGLHGCSGRGVPTTRFQRFDNCSNPRLGHTMDVLSPFIRFRTGQGPCRANLHKCVSSNQLLVIVTMNHIVDTCPFWLTLPRRVLSTSSCGKRMIDW